jgi:hypothetical protein
LQFLYFSYFYREQAHSSFRCPKGLYQLCRHYKRSSGLWSLH